MLDPKLAQIYQKYNEVLKPLIAEFESRDEIFVTPLLKDLPQMLDSIFSYSLTKEDCHLESAECQLNNAINTVRFFLNASLMKEIKEFKARFPENILMSLDNGHFYATFINLESEARANKENSPEITFKCLKQMKSMIDDGFDSSLIATLRMEKKKEIIGKWVASIIIALLINALILVL